MGKNPLDEIGGIGPTRKRALLRHFGTAKAVSKAGVEDLVAVEGISEATAQAIYDHFPRVARIADGARPTRAPIALQSMPDVL